MFYDMWIIVISLVSCSMLTIKKVFDNIERDFILHALTKLTFGKSFIQCVSAILKNTTNCIINNAVSALLTLNYQLLRACKKTVTNCENRSDFCTSVLVRLIIITSGKPALRGDLR